jgi:peptidase inhibitor family I36
VLAGCAKEPVVAGPGGTSPNPNGCYVFVYDQANQRGERVILNGPGKWPTLERLRRDDKDWRKRIRSIEVGSGATVTLYTEPDFRGVSQLFGPGSDEARLNASMSVGIESLALSCRPANP